MEKEEIVTTAEESEAQVEETPVEDTPAEAAPKKKKFNSQVFLGISVLAASIMIASAIMVNAIMTRNKPATIVYETQSVVEEISEPEVDYQEAPDSVEIKDYSFLMTDEEDIDYGYRIDESWNGGCYERSNFFNSFVGESDILKMYKNTGSKYNQFIELGPVCTEENGLLVKEDVPYDWIPMIQKTLLTELFAQPQYKGAEGIENIMFDNLSEADLNGRTFMKFDCTYQLSDGMNVKMTGLVTVTHNDSEAYKTPNTIGFLAMAPATDNKAMMLADYYCKHAAQTLAFPETELQMAEYKADVEAYEENNAEEIEETEESE